jgi:hypothetical protein
LGGRNDFILPTPRLEHGRFTSDANGAGALKPVAAAFKAATDIVGVSADRIVFLDDDHLNIDAAIRHGLAVSSSIRVQIMTLWQKWPGCGGDPRVAEFVAVDTSHKCER